MNLHEGGGIEESKSSAICPRFNQPQNANFTGRKARAASGVVYRLLLTQEHRLDIARLKHFPAVPKRDDFDYCHDLRFAFCSK
jgi:hypothetical protein